MRDWEPTGMLRWVERVQYCTRYERVLQQEWRKTTGGIGIDGDLVIPTEWETEWRDVPVGTEEPSKG